MARKTHQRPGYTSPLQRERARETQILLRWQEEAQFRRTHKAAAAIYEKFKEEASVGGEWYPSAPYKVQ